MDPGLFRRREVSEDKSDVRGKYIPDFRLSVRGRSRRDLEASMPINLAALSETSGFSSGGAGSVGLSSISNDGRLDIGLDEEAGLRVDLLLDWGVPSTMLAKATPRWFLEDRPSRSRRFSRSDAEDLSTSGSGSVARGFRVDSFFLGDSTSSGIFGSFFNFFGGSTSSWILGSFFNFFGGSASS